MIMTHLVTFSWHLGCWSISWDHDHHWLSLGTGQRHNLESLPLSPQCWLATDSLQWRGKTYLHNASSRLIRRKSIFKIIFRSLTWVWGWWLVVDLHSDGVGDTGWCWQFLINSTTIFIPSTAHCSWLRQIWQGSVSLTSVLEKFIGWYHNWDISFLWGSESGEKEKEIEKRKTGKILQLH